MSRLSACRLGWCAVLVAAEPVSAPSPAQVAEESRCVWILLTTPRTLRCIFCLASCDLSPPAEVSPPHHVRLSSAQLRGDHFTIHFRSGGSSTVPLERSSPRPDRFHSSLLRPFLNTLLRPRAADYCGLLLLHRSRRSTTPPTEEPLETRA